ncbi:MAG: hypothetical protein LBE76_05700 [Nitrososphaerota archaeon]|nr:hypothetical protein [Nitrososphaerota archaeon]
MVKIDVKCIHCNGKDIVKMGKQTNGKPRCRCKTCGKTFQTQYTSNGATPQTKVLIGNVSKR